MKRLGAAIAYLAAVRFVFNTILRMMSVFLPAIARGLGVSLESAGLLVSARSLAGAAIPAVVATAGRGERRLRLATWGMMLFTAGALLTAATSVYAGALAGFVLLGLAKPAFDTAAIAYVADRTPYDRRARYLSIIELTWAGGLLIGAPASGWLISRFDWTAPFWVAAALGAGAIVSAPFFLDADVGDGDLRRAPLALNRSAIALLGVLVAISVGSEIAFVVFGAWMEDVFDLSLVALGAAGLAIGVAELIGEGGVFSFADRVGKRRMVMFGSGASAIGYVALAGVADDLTLSLVILGVVFIAFEITVVSALPLATEVVPHARARFLALIIVAVSIGRAIGAAAGPLVYKSGGMPANALVAAATMLIALVLIVRWVRE
ncbi:MAG TPA: MFS transporter [Acidimicrobiia bacterium]|nr:MFS transporter [Acidimicrobiia bacterium]